MRHHFLLIRSSRLVNYATIRMDAQMSAQVSTKKRYVPLELPGSSSINERVFQKVNGVLDILENSLHYTYSVYPGSSIKEKNEYKIYQRPTINWNIECEDKMSKIEAYDFFMSKDAQIRIGVQDLKSYSFGVAGITILAISLLSCCCTAVQRQSEPIISMCVMMQIMVFGFLVAGTIKPIKLALALRESNDRLSADHEFVNSCVDEATRFGSQLQKQIDIQYSQTLQFGTIAILLLVYSIFLGRSICFLDLLVLVGDHQVLYSWLATRA